MKTTLTSNTFEAQASRRFSLRRSTSRRWIATGLAALTCFTALPLTNANAQVVPPRTGYGNPYGNVAMQTTVRGTISSTSTLSNADAGVFTLRTTNNETLRVILHQDIRYLGESRYFQTNNRVEIEGVRDGDILIARDVRFFENNQYLSILRGVVQSDVRNNRFTLTINDPSTGSSYGYGNYNRTRNVQVNARGTSLNNIRRGDEVELRGTWQGNGRFNTSSVFNADSVTFIGDADGYYPGDDNYQSGRLTTLRGTVLDDAVNNRENRFRISLRTNQTVEVRGVSNPRVNRNDYVEVRGRWNRDESVFRADSVRVLDVRDNDRESYRVDFRGTVVNFSSGNRITVRGDNGREYQVIAPVNLDRNISRGDRVRVVGTVERDGTTRAESVTLEGSSYGYTDIDFTGTITEVPTFGRNNYTVRTNEGRVFRVNFSGSTNVRVGDRVRVRGRLNNNVVDADSMVRI